MAEERVIAQYKSIEIREDEKWVYVPGEKHSKPIPTRISRNGNSWCCRFNLNIGKYLGFHLGDPVKIVIIPDLDRKENDK